MLSKEERRQAETQTFGPVDCQLADHLTDSAAWFTLSPNVIIVGEGAAGSAAMAIEIEAWHQVAE
jgi:hypothetical protein